MKTIAKFILVALLAFGIGLAYASPMIISPRTVQPFPRVPEGIKAPFSVDVVYANFNPVDFQYTRTNYDWSGNPFEETYPATNISYSVVFNVTNLSDQTATLYDLSFTAAQDISVKQSILGGAIYNFGVPAQNNVLAGSHFGGIVSGVYLDGKWVNVTWIPHIYLEDMNGTQTSTPYPLDVYLITEANWNDGIIQGPLTPDDIVAFSADHALNSTIPRLPDNASDTGIWFEGVPITEYYDQQGKLSITEMYINGAWVDVTGKITIDNTQPLMFASNVLVDAKLTLGEQPYTNMNSTAGPVTALPTWGDWGTGIAYPWFPWDWNRPGFDNVFAPRESRLLVFNNTEMFIKLNDTDAPSNGAAALQTGNLKLYASASNYITNWPVNGTYYNTVSTATKVIDIHLEQTAGGYVYNKILGDNQTFEPGNSNLEVNVVTGIES